MDIIDEILLPSPPGSPGLPPFDPDPRQRFSIIMPTKLYEPSAWSCACCCEKYNDYARISIDHQNLCTKCVKDMFERAITAEINYPPKWSLGPLHPKHFSHIISAEFIERYEVREREYLCAFGTRIYCKHIIHNERDGKTDEACGAFVGAKTAILLGVDKCATCSGLTCLNCSTALRDRTSAIEHLHDCEKLVGALKLAEAEEEAKAFAGLTQGRHYQRCPNAACGVMVELGEACNHMTCAYCWTEFCFVCGTEQTALSEHWRRGGCPRYNFPGDQNAGYDGGSDRGFGGGEGWAVNEWGEYLVRDRSQLRRPPSPVQNGAPPFARSLPSTRPNTPPAAEAWGQRGRSTSPVSDAGGWATGSQRSASLPRSSSPTRSASPATVRAAVRERFAAIRAQD